MFGRWLLVWILSLNSAGAGDFANSVAVGSRFSARDTLSCGAEPDDDARKCLDGLKWTGAEFTISLETAQPDRGDFLVRFPSARPLGNEINDLVALEWYAAKEIDKSLRKARAIVIVHESGQGMTIGRMMAKGLSSQGLHAFMMQMPGYGSRKVPGPVEPARMLSALQQAVADARRARDAVAGLPPVDNSVIGLQGTSLGGFVTATAAGLDHGFDRVFILLAGGNLHDVVLNGQKDAAGVREKLRSAGMTDDQIIALTKPVEPLRLAHRLNPNSTWLYSGLYDDVVPPACSLALVKAAHLPKGHHLELPADHYSGVIFLPTVMMQIYERMTTDVTVAPE